MFNKMKKSVIIIVALVVCTAIMLSACNPNAFKPVELPAEANVEGNGGVAVKYGDYIYYVNGYESSTEADNGYDNAIRVGQIVRVKISDIDHAYEVYDETGKTADAQSNLSEKIEVVVPNYYYSNNTTDTSLNGIYIFDSKLYITTPNEELNAGGYQLSSQLKLVSYSLNGDDKQELYTFTDNTAQIMLAKAESGALCAVYTQTANSETKLLRLKLGEKSAPTEISEEGKTSNSNAVTSVKFDKSTNSVFYINSENNLCVVENGEKTGKVLVKNAVLHDHGEGDVHYQYTFTISAVNNGYVYYTVADANDSSLDNKQLYYTDCNQQTASFSRESAKVIYNVIPSATYFVYKNSGIVMASSVSADKTLYGISFVKSNGEKSYLLNPEQNDSSITLVKLEGNLLYYTINNISYKLDISAESATPVAYANGLSTSATGWSVADVVESSNYNYVFTLASGSVSLVRFDKANNTNSATLDITLKAVEAE